jgi:hypothetical protein
VTAADRAAQAFAADGHIRLIAGHALFALAGITAIVSYLHALAVVRAVGNSARSTEPASLTTNSPT